jgi:hypothetical protein
MPPSPPWTATQRALFRFAFVYFAIFTGADTLRLRGSAGGDSLDVLLRRLDETKVFRLLAPVI